jgi:hypothetical protein
MPDESRHPTFDEVYPKYEFAPLVSITLYAAEWIMKRFARTGGRLEVVHQGREPAGEV